MEERNQQLGRNIQMYRRARQMTLEDLAVQISKSKATISKYEQGKITLDIDTLFEIAEALGVRPQLLLTDLTPGKRKRPLSGVTQGMKRYLYNYDGRIKRIVRSLLICGEEEQGETPAALFYNLPSLEGPHRCRGLYCGYMKQHDFVTNYLLENQRNDIEHVFLCFNCPLDYSGQEQGLLSGISSRTMLPVSAKCILSDQPLVEDENLISALLLTREDLRLTKKYNMFMLE